MNPRPVIATVVVGGALVTAYLMWPREDHTMVFGARLAESTFLEAQDPAAAFGAAVGQRLQAELLARFAIDASDEALRAYVRTETPELVSFEQTRSGQVNRARAADALEAVYKDGVPVDEAYERFDLQSVMDLASWRQTAADSAPEKKVAAMRLFADADVESVHTQTIDQMRFIYLQRMIRESICEAPPTDSAEAEIGPELTCMMRSNNYLRDLLAVEVRFRSPELEGYQAFISLIAPIPFQLEAEDGRK